MNWKYKNRLLPQKEPSSWGFIYILTFEDDSLYVGKKQMWSVVTMVAKKDESKRLGHVCFLNKRKGGKIVKHETIKTENSWRTYNGSSKATKHLKVKNKEILCFCTDKLHLTYTEEEWLFKLDVLRSEMYHNDCIGGRYYKGKIK